jgi:hypothetical protein
VLRRARFQARTLGKLVTVLQLATLFAVIIAPAIVTGLIVAVGLLSVVSIADYTIALWRARDRG